MLHVGDFTKIPFHSPKKGIQAEQVPALKKPPALFSGGAHSKRHFYRLAICSSLTLILSTPMGAIDGVESLGFCG